MKVSLNKVHQALNQRLKAIMMIFVPCYLMIVPDKEVPEEEEGDVSRDVDAQ